MFLHSSYNTMFSHHYVLTTFITVQLQLKMTTHIKQYTNLRRFVIEISLLYFFAIKSTINEHK